MHPYLFCVILTAADRQTNQTNRPKQTDEKQYLLGGGKQNTEDITELTASTDQCGFWNSSKLKNTLELPSLNTSTLSQKRVNFDKLQVRQASTDFDNFG